MKNRVILLVCAVALISGCSNSEGDDLDPLMLLLFANQAQTPADGFAGEAAAAGHTVPNVPVTGFSEFSVDGNQSRTLTGGCSGTVPTRTTQVCYISYANKPTYCWTNSSSMGCSFGATQVRTCRTQVLNSGNNYLAMLSVDGNGNPVGRSPVCKITSTAAASKIRFELSWTGSGDVDLHVDDGSGGRHVFFGSTTYSSGGYSIKLDTDNTTGFGPENVTVEQLPSTSNFRVYLNYFSGSISQTATVRIFRNESLSQTVTATFSASDANASSAFNSKSKTIGTFSVSP